MDIDNCVRSMPVSIEGMKQADNLCFDGSFYYFLIHNRLLIVKTDLELHSICSYEICRQYSSICFDWKENCFWAVCRETGQIIYKLNCEMKEIGTIRICGSPEARNPITSISYNYCADNLMAAYNNTIIRVNKANGRYEMCYRLRNGVITAIASLSPGFLVAFCSGEKQVLFSVKPDMTTVELYSRQTEETIRTVIFHPAGEKCETTTFDILLKKGGDSSLRCVSFCDCQLGYEICDCNYSICHRTCCKPDPKPCPPRPCPGPCPDPCPGPCPNPVHCYDIIESIALIEAAISHILNAEGEKLQKVIKSTDDIHTLLCVNQSVNDMVINVTGLEHELYAKLSIAYKLCQLKDQNPDRCSTDCSACQPCSTASRPPCKSDLVDYLRDNILNKNQNREPG